MNENISSPHNPRIKQTLRLRDRDQRDQRGLLLIEHLRELNQALAGGIEIVELFLDERYESLAEVFADQNLPPLEESLRSQIDSVTTLASRAAMEKLSYGDRISPVIAVAKQWACDLAKIIPQDYSLVLVIDSVEKPGNLGAMVRTADAVGVTGVILSDPICDLWNSNAIRASQGAIFRLPIAVSTASETQSWLQTNRFQIATARVEASVAYNKFAWAPRSAIVLGSEAQGLGNRWQESSIQGINVPMRGSVDSLNVSVTAAVLMYDAMERMKP
jgi:TrmH family RNA methyltransferase